MPVKKTTTPPAGTKAVEEGPWRIDEESGKKVRNSRALPYENKIKELLFDAAAIVSFQDEFTAIAMRNQAPEIAYGWAKLGSEDPRVKRVLSLLLEGSAWAEALLPTLTLLVAVMWHYGVFIPDKLGVPVSLAAGAIPVSREVEQKMKAEAAGAARQAAAAERQDDVPINGSDDDK